MGCVYAKSGIGRYHGRTQIEACSGAVGNPVALDLDELTHCLIVVLDVDLGHAQTPCGAVETPCVIPGAEHQNAVVIGAICLESLENLLSIVENSAGRIEAKLLVRYDACIMPYAVIIVHHEHMIGETLAKTKRTFFFTGRLGLKLCCLGDRNIH